MKLLKLIIYSFVFLLSLQSNSFALSTSSLSPFKNCFLKLTELIRPKQSQLILDELKRSYRNFDHIVREQNDAFIDFVLKEERQKSVLFYQMENAVLKDLNDKVFLDKNVSQALNIKYQKLLLEKIKADYFLKKNILHEYADYKSIRFVFKSKNNDSHFKKQLKIAEDLALKEFQDFLKTSFLSDFVSSRLKRTGTPKIEKWFLSGLSDDPTLSAIKARYFRKHPRPDFRDVKGESDYILSFLWEERKKMLDLEMDLIYFYRQNFEQLAHSPFVKDEINGNDMISFEILRIFRKLKNTDKDFETAQIQMFDYLGIIIDHSTFEKHLRFISMLNEFSPPVYQPFTRAVSFQATNKGIISIDIANLGLEGLFSLYKNMRRPQIIGDMMQSLADGYWPVHHKLLNVYRPVAEGLIRSGNLKFAHKIESGDDLLYFFKKAIDDEAMEKIIRTAAASEYPNKFRIVQIPSRYKDTGKKIKEIRMSRFITRAETLEKDIRNLLRDQYSLEFARSTSIGVRVSPHSTQKSSFEVFIKVKDFNYSSRHLETILEKIRSLNSDVQFVVLP